MRAACGTRKARYIGGMTMKTIANIKDSYISAKAIGISLAGAIALVFSSHVHAMPPDAGVARWLITAAATADDSPSVSQSSSDTQAAQSDATDTSATVDPCVENP